MPNTFLRLYLNSELISLVVRLMVFPRKDAIYMVPRPLKKLGDNFILHCVHNCGLGVVRWMGFGGLLGMIGF